MFPRWPRYAPGVAVAMPQPVAEEPTELDLVRRLRDGDQAAGAALVRRYERPLGGYLRRLAGDVSAAEELLQATWTSVLEHLDKFDTDDPTANFKAWLFRIASNKSHDRWRRVQRDHRLHRGLRMTAEVGGSAGADAAAMAGEDADRLRTAIDALPPPQKQVVLMRYYGGMKFTEIAETLGCPLNTALGRMHKAMQKLKIALDAQEPI
jgi:RNA polymerase sigma-70 factor (ECF subfamily)